MMIPFAIRLPPTLGRSAMNEYRSRAMKSNEEKMHKRKWLEWLINVHRIHKQEGEVFF